MLAAIILTLLLIRGTPRVRFATCWILLSLLPFSFFTWSNTSRYSYMPAVGFGWLVADALQWLDRRLVERTGVRMATTVTTLLAAFIAVRFMLFASKNIAHFAERTEPYRQAAETFRRNYPNPPRGARLPVDVETADRLQFRYVEALAQWEYRDPLLRLDVRP